jgi:hypothetical protein
MNLKKIKAKKIEKNKFKVMEKVLCKMGPKKKFQIII